MVSKLEGKKLLILAGGPHLVSLIKRAKELGVYTIVTDYYNTDESPGKLVADEYWNISWADVDALEHKCRENNINGITTGYSESPVEKCIELCERLGLPCYCTKEQLAFTRDKKLFKKICRENSVPTVKEYPDLLSVDEYPVIMKPTDRAGSIGVGIAKSPEDLEKVYNYALEMSYSKEVVIEKYMTGTKIDVYYEIKDGVATLLSTDSVIFADNNGLDRVVQSAWVLPSPSHYQIVNKADKNLRCMIHNLGIKDGYLFISGFEEQGEFVFFECGFRLCGGHLYNYFSKLGLDNNLDIFIYHALTGSTADVKSPSCPESGQDLKCVTLNIYSKAGTIEKIEGISQIEDMEDCELSLLTAKIGQTCKADKAILDKVYMCYFCNSDPNALKHDVQQAYEYLHIEDIDHNDMIYDRIDANRIANYWD